MGKLLIEKVFLINLVLIRAFEMVKVVVSIHLKEIPRSIFSIEEEQCPSIMSLVLLIKTHMTCHPAETLKIKVLIRVLRNFILVPILRVLVHASSNNLKTF